MVNRLLDRKLVRDLRTHLGSVVAIAVVVACGVAAFVAERSIARILADSQSEYYAQVRFPSIFAQVKRAPDAAADRLRAIPGIARLEVRATGEVVLRIPGLREPASARIVGTREPPLGSLNRLVVREGRLPLAGERDAVIASAGFADANHLSVGDTLGAVIGSAWRSLRIVGIGTTAEFVYELRPGDVLPDPRRYGVLWMEGEVAADLLGYSGAWNDLAAELDAGADTSRVIAALDAELDRYGTLGAYRRARHPSHQFVSEEIRQNRTFAMAIPAIFLGVAAFLVHLVLGRIVTQQRDQVGTLKAFGMPARALMRHYALLALVPVVAGAAIGTPVGLWFAGRMVVLYADFFRFPTLTLRFLPAESLTALAISMAAALIGALGALRRLLKLHPAEAMRPEAPATFTHGLADRLVTARLRSPVRRMIGRGLLRQPVRTAFSALGIGFGAAVVVVGTFGFDAIGRMRSVMFDLAMRADVIVSFVEPQGRPVLDALAALPGVTRVEPLRDVAARVRHGHVERTAAVSGIDPRATLRAIARLDATAAEAAPSGVTLGGALSRVLDARVGDTVDIAFLEGHRRRVRLPVAAVVEDVSGLGAYVPADALPALVGTGPFVTGADLAVMPDSLDALYDRLAHSPTVRTVLVRDAVRDAFDDTLRRNFVTVLVTLVIFAGALAAGTIYNAGRVALSERARDLASLRVLGFSRVEVARMLFGELAVLAAIGLPVGLLLGAGLAWLVVWSFGTTELFRMPFVIGPRTIVAGLSVPIAVGVLATIPLRRRLDHLDLVGVLKTRE